MCSKSVIFMASPRLQQNIRDWLEQLDKSKNTLFCGIKRDAFVLYRTLMLLQKHYSSVLCAFGDLSLSSFDVRLCLPLLQQHPEATSVACILGQSKAF